MDDERLPALADSELRDGYGEIVGCNIAIPPGEYIVAYCHYETGYYRDSAKVTVHFAVLEPDSFAGTPLERFYNVHALSGPPKRFGKFKVTARQSIFREMTELIGDVGRHDRITPSRLKGMRIKCEVDTVTRDGGKQAIPKELQYSRIKRLISVMPELD